MRAASARAARGSARLPPHRAEQLEQPAGEAGDVIGIRARCPSAEERHPSTVRTAAMPAPWNIYDSVLASGVAFKRVELKHPARSIVLVGVGVFAVVLAVVLVVQQPSGSDAVSSVLAALACGFYGAAAFTALSAGFPSYNRLREVAGADGQTRVRRRRAVLARNIPAIVDDELDETRQYASRYLDFQPYQAGFIVPLGLGAIALELSLPASNGMMAVIRIIGVVAGVACVVVGPLILRVQSSRLRRFLDATAGFEPANDGL
ncbi:hypothetical protein GCM10027029_33160 [Conyzicola lurida]